ncbi:hypothetical protein D1872_221380 [compost metagenome]
MFDSLAREQLLPHFCPAFNLVDAAARVFVQRNVEALDQFGVRTLDEIRMIFRGMLGRFGHIVAEAEHEFITDHIVVDLFLLLGRPAFDFRIQILPVPLDLQQPGHMIDPGDLRLHPVRIHAERFEQTRHAHLNAVA